VTDNLPRNWRLERLGDCCEIVSGATPRREVPNYWGGSIPWVTPKDISDLDEPVFSDPPESISEEGYRSCSSRLVPIGSILFSSRAPIGLVAIAGRSMCTNQGFKSVVPGAEIDSHYLYYCLKRLVPRIQAMGNGATFKEVSKVVMERVEIPLPPHRSDQERIAAILHKADAIRRKRRQALVETDALLRAAYLELVGLQNRKHDSWPLVTVGDVAAKHGNAMRTGPFGSDLLHSEFTDQGIAVLGIDNAVQNRFAWGERRFISEKKYKKLQRYRVFPGDVIVTIMGTTGRSAVIPDDVPEAITTKHLATITPDRRRVHPLFLSFAIHSDPLIIRQMEKASRGAIMAGLNLGIIKALAVRLPPLQQQERFAGVAIRIFQQQWRLRDPQVNGVDLFASISDRAFSGEL
jgi:type I restriction enzyme S subunit